MIYSDDIEKHCSLCRFAKIDGENIYCEKKKRNMPLSSEVCKKFSYDIIKKPARRKKRLRTDFSPEDFSLFT